MERKKDGWGRIETKEKRDAQIGGRGGSWVWPVVDVYWDSI